MLTPDDQLIYRSRRTEGGTRRGVAVAISACLPTSLSLRHRRGRSPPPGWVFSPGVAVGETWDNNVVLSSDGSGSTGDFLTAITPRAVLSFRGRQSTFQVNYLGSFQLYQELTELNSYDHRSNSSYRYRLTPTLSFFATNSLSRSPTTDEVNIPGVFFRRQGVIIERLPLGLRVAPIESLFTQCRLRVSVGQLR